MDKEITIIYFVGTIFIILLVVFVILYVILHQLKVNKFKLEIKEKDYANQEELYQAINITEELERKRIAEELHDGIGAKLSGIKLSLEYLKNQQDVPNADMEMIEKLNEYLDETIVEIREITHNLKPSSLFKKGLKNALEDLINQFNQNKKCEYQLYIDDEITYFEKDYVLIFRICSELLQNIYKHSKADKAYLQINVEGKKLQITAEDNGIGFDFSKIKSGIGLDNIKSRIHELNGKFVLESSENGTLIIIELE